MAAHVAAYRAANGMAHESWRPCAADGDAIARSLPSDQGNTFIVGDVDMKDSKDVVLDNVTVFEGPVTVQQVQVDEGVPTGKSAKDDVGESSSDPCGFGSCAFRWAIGLAIVTLVVIAITATLVSSNGDPKEKEKKGEGADVHDGKSLLLMSRDQWGGMPPKEPADNLTLPVPFVIISHTATEHCNSLEECSAVVRSVQAFHMGSRNWWDIGYNFLVGGDGRAYEARGWGAVGAHARSYNNVSIGVSFIGTFSDVAPPQRQVDAFKSLVAEGVRLGKVAKDYALLAHRQVSPTESPGEKLYDLMKHWPHWTELLS